MNFFNSGKYVESNKESTLAFYNASHVTNKLLKPIKETDLKPELPNFNNVLELIYKNIQEEEKKLKEAKEEQKNQATATNNNT